MVTNYNTIVSGIEQEMFATSDSSYNNIKLYYDKIITTCPDLISLTLNENYDTKVLMKYAMEEHSGYVKVFYGLKTILFEKESDKLLFLLKYGR